MLLLSWLRMTNDRRSQHQQAMVLYSDVQATAHQEFDRIVGAAWLPEWTDWHTLPYVRSCMKESLSWGPATITSGMPHAAAKDSVYMGYTIPSPPPLPFPPSSRQKNTQLTHIHPYPSILTPDLNPQQLPLPPYALCPQQQRRRARTGTRVADRALSVALTKAAVGVSSSARAAGTPDQAGCCGGWVCCCCARCGLGAVRDCAAGWGEGGDGEEVSRRFVLDERGDYT